MGRTSLRRLCACALLLLFALPGCEYKSITVRFHQLERDRVEGVRLWRQSDDAGGLEEMGAIVFAGIRDVKGVETLFYTQLNPDGSEGYPLRSPITRHAEDPDQVTVRLWYARWEDPGWFRVTAFNHVGESPISNEQVFL